MASSRFEFFALPEEQSAWLTTFLENEGVWCLASADGLSDPVAVARGERMRIDDLLSASRGCCAFYLGNRHIEEAPVLTIGANGRPQLDFIRSQAVELSPSYISHGTILIMGQMAIMAKGYYLDIGLDPVPLQTWFRQMVKSFRRIMHPRAVITQTTTSGTVKQWPGVGVTPGAVEWWTKGGLLKAIATSPVTFNVAEKEKKKK
jgi:hypothetical protein